MTRVCGVVGTWQLVTLVAALREADGRLDAPERSDDVLLVYETGGATEEFKATLDRMARAAWPWKRVVWAYDLLTSRSRFSERELGEALVVVRERVGLGPEEPAEIWVCWLVRAAERLLFEAFPSAPIVLYEDGLTTYLPVRTAANAFLSLPEGSPPLKRLRRRLMAALGAPTPAQRFRYLGTALDLGHLARLRAAYLQLSPTEPLPEALATVPRVQVGYDRLRGVLEQVARHVADALPSSDEGAANRVLVLGQSLSRNGVVPRATELEFYRTVVGAILARGYRVVWKDHPRVSEPFYGDLAASCGEDRVERLALAHAFPIELVAPRLGLAACVAGSTAALFYLRRLYGLPCYTYAEDLLPHLRAPDAFMARMVVREARPLSHLATAPLPDCPPEA